MIFSLKLIILTFSALSEKNYRGFLKIWWACPRASPQTPWPTILTRLKCVAHTMQQYVKIKIQISISYPVFFISICAFRHLCNFIEIPIYFIKNQKQNENTNLSRKIVSFFSRQIINYISEGFFCKRQLRVFYCHVNL